MCKLINKPILFAFLSVFSLVLSFAPLANAQTRTLVILKTLSNPTMNEREAVFIREIEARAAENGYRLNLIQLDMQNDTERGASLLTQVLTTEKVDLLIPLATKATDLAWRFREQLKEEGAQTFFFFVADPVGLGIVDQIGGSSGYRFSGYVNAMDRKTKLDMVIRMLNQSNPGLKRVLLVHSTYPAEISDAQALQARATEFPDLQFTPLQLEYELDKGAGQYHAEMDQLIRDQDLKFDYIWVGLGPLGRNVDFLKSIVSDPNHSQPVIMSSDESGVQAGALFTITSNAEIDGRSAAVRADQLLAGLSAADVPVERAPNFLFAVNLKTAEQMGIVVPPSILKLSLGHIYQ